MKKVIKTIFWLLVVILVIIVGVEFADSKVGKKIASKIKNEDTTSTVSLNEETEVPAIEKLDVEAYYEENSEIVSMVSSEKSEDVLTEREVTSVLEDKGFSEYEIVSDYSMDGTYCEEMSISASSEDVHPMYYTYFESEEGIIWAIIVINGQVMANPLSYNLQDNPGVAVLYSESESVTCYDGEKNRFYETIPNESELRVKVIDQINADTLNSITKGDIES